MSQPSQKIVIVGGGFAGFWAAVAAQRELSLKEGSTTTSPDIEVTLITPSPKMTIRPRLYEANPDQLTADIATPLACIGVKLVLGKVTKIDPTAKTLLVDASQSSGHQEPYDRLVLTLGSQLNLPVLPGFSQWAHSIDTLSQAQRLENHLKALTSLKDETKGRGNDKPPSSLTLAVLGAGFAGLELACELRSRLTDLLGAKTADAANILLIDQSDRPGDHLGDDSQSALKAALNQAGVTFLGNTNVKELEKDRVHFTDGSSRSCQALVVTTGLQAHPLARDLAKDLELTCDDLGRLPTQRSLLLPNQPDILVAGDLAQAKVDDTHQALMSCQHAMPMGRQAGVNAVRSLRALPLEDYSQPRYVTCLDLGPWGAVFTSGWDRKVEMIKDEAKGLKRQICREWIYPPQGEAQSILDAAAPPPETATADAS